MGVISLLQFLCYTILIIGPLYAIYLIYQIAKELLTRPVAYQLPGSIHTKDCTCWLCNPPPLPSEQRMITTGIKRTIATTTGRNSQGTFTPYPTTNYQAQQTYNMAKQILASVPPATYPEDVI